MRSGGDRRQAGGGASKSGLSESLWATPPASCVSLSRHHISKLISSHAARQRGNGHLAKVRDPSMITCMGGVRGDARVMPRPTRSLLSSLFSLPASSPDCRNQPGNVIKAAITSSVSQVSSDLSIDVSCEYVRTSRFLESASARLGTMTWTLFSPDCRNQTREASIEGGFRGWSRRNARYSTSASHPISLVDIEPVSRGSPVTELRSHLHRLLVVVMLVVRIGYCVRSAVP